MNRASLSLHCAAGRAQWLADLASALDDASGLALELASQRGASAEAAALKAHIRTLRREVEAIRAL